MARYILDVNTCKGLDILVSLSEHIAAKFGQGCVTLTCIDPVNGPDQFKNEESKGAKRYLGYTASGPCSAYVKKCDYTGNDFQAYEALDEEPEDGIHPMFYECPKCGHGCLDKVFRNEPKGA